MKVKERKLKSDKIGLKVKNDRFNLQLLKIITLFLFIVSLSYLFFNFNDKNLNLSSSVSAQTPSDTEWWMAGGNPQRTSWVSTAPEGSLGVDWYVKFEPFIGHQETVGNPDPNHNIIYLGSANGIVALAGDTGTFLWRYDTQLPVGIAPTVVNNVLYFGGMDRKLHALNALTGQPLWEFSGASGGFSVNPLVVNGKVLSGSRDGYFYAINADPDLAQGGGQLIWQYPRAGQPPIGAIDFSAAYDPNQNAVYFASGNMRGYALNADTGDPIWFHNEGGQQVAGSEKLPGLRYDNFWPVIFRDYVIFSGSTPYKSGGREDERPGSASVDDSSGNNHSEYINGIMTNAFFPNGGEIGPRDNGFIDYACAFEYFEEPTTGTQTTLPQCQNMDLHKPWRRTMAMLSKTTGQEVTFDIDNDGQREYIPYLMMNRKEGTPFPPVVNPMENRLYFSSLAYRMSTNIARSLVLGFDPDNPRYLKIAGLDTAIDEPHILTAAGSDTIIRNHGEWGTAVQGGRVVSYWDNSSTSNPNKLSNMIPGFDSMYGVLTGFGEFYTQTYYQGLTNSINAGSWNDFNGLVPYRGRVYVHKSNALISFGTQNTRTEKPAISKNSSRQDTVNVPSDTALVSNLESEIRKIVNAGDILKPGYHSYGIQTLYFFGFKFPFESPAETLMVLSQAYPLIQDTQLKADLSDYLNRFYQKYYQTQRVIKIRWNSGAERTEFNYPLEVVQDMPNLTDITTVDPNYMNYYPQINLYALWKYAQVNPTAAGEIYQLARANLVNPAPIDLDWETSWGTFGRFSNDGHPWRVNDFIAGYIGLLELNQMNSSPSADAGLINQVTQELDRLISMRANNFNKDHPWVEIRASGRAPVPGIYYYRTNYARNFLYLVKDTAPYIQTRLGDTAYANYVNKVREAVNEYSYMNPYWFTNWAHYSLGENLTDIMENIPSMFAAKAYVLNEPKEELYKYLDNPRFNRGDLYYIQNLVATLEASTANTNSDINGDGSINVDDALILFNNWFNPSTSTVDIYSDNRVNGIDFSYLKRDWKP
jgi:hypothetical protein